MAYSPNLTISPTEIEVVDPEGGIRLAALETEFKQLLQEIPEGYWDRLGLMRVIQSLFKKLRLPSGLADSTEVTHLTVQLVMAFAKINVWGGAGQYFADSEHEQYKVAAAFAGFIGLLPQLLSLIRLKISLPGRVNAGHWLQRTLAGMGTGFVLPLMYYTDLPSLTAGTDAWDALYQAGRLGCFMALAETAVPPVLHNATELLRRTYIQAKKKYRTIRNERPNSPLFADDDDAPLLGNDPDFSDRTLQQTMKDQNYSQSTRRVMRVLDEYNNLPSMWLLFIVSYILFISLYESEGTQYLRSSPFGFNNLATFMFFVVAAIFSKIHAYLNR